MLAAAGETFPSYLHFWCMCYNLKTDMITTEEEAYILSKAYVPEHIVSLMALISKGEPFLIRDCLCYVKDNWVIVIGYPLNGEFAQDSFKALFQEVTSKFEPEYVWIAAPEVPDEYAKSSLEMEHDEYYRLELKGFKAKGSLVREVNKAMERLTVEKTNNFTKEQKIIIEEFVKREKPGDRIKELYLSMPGYVAASKTAMLLNARDTEGHLSAFYVIELAATEFAAYVVGCHSKKNYVSHASDLLFYEMVMAAQEKGKTYINLGLGVNDGIRRFKEKWGGIPFLKYTFCEYHRGRKNIPRLVTSFISAMKNL